MMKLARLVLAGSIAAPALIAATEAYALTCAVESHVIRRTQELERNVTEQINTSERLLIEEEKRQRQMLLSALQVVTKQESASGQQTATVTKKSAEAAAATNVQQRQAWAIADAKERYGTTGYDACGLQVKGQTFYAANRNSRGEARAMAGSTYFEPGGFGSPRPWAQFATSDGKTFDGESVFRGGQEAEDYINFIAGPPVEDVPDGANRQAFILQKNRHDVRRSVAKEVLASIAAQHAPDGPRKALDELTKHWTGDDGGETWAAAMADKPLRGALLDAVRIEAANIAVMAYQAKDTMRTETALASYALARINAILQGGGGTIPQTVSTRPEMRAEAR